MGKSLTTKTIARYVAFLLYCLSPVGGFCQTGELVTDVLVEMGFENVRWTEDETERVYVLQNSIYRLQGVGIGKAVDVIQRWGIPHGKSCRVIVLDNGVPQISLCYRRTAEVDTLSVVRRQVWDASYELGGAWKKVKRAKTKNSSLFKVDVLVYPQLSFRNLILTQIYQVLFDLSPAVEVSFWSGMRLTAQLKVPVYNDGYGDYEGKIHPGHLTLSQSFRLPYQLFGKLTVGCFSADRFGVDVALRHPFKDERLSAMVRVGYTGVGFWDGFRYHYDTDMTLTWTLGAGFYWPQYNTQFLLKAEQYLKEDRGVKFEMIRHFRYCSIGFYAMKAKEAKANGGFRFQVALPPYRCKRYKNRWPRIDTAPSMGIIYNAGNERYYYKEYKAEACDNIIKENSFNPYFIKSELLNF